jgi:hypothetical protein
MASNGDAHSFRGTGLIDHERCWGPCPGGIAGKEKLHGVRQRAHLHQLGDTCTGVLHRITPPSSNRVGTIVKHLRIAECVGLYYSGI